jgi:hypothetical protein
LEGARIAKLHEKCNAICVGGEGAAGGPRPVRRREDFGSRAIRSRPFAPWHEPYLLICWKIAQNWHRVPRPFTRAQAHENRAFLKALARTGNAREAARAVGAHRAKFTRRRARDAAFAAEWDSALASAHAMLRQGRGAGTAGEPTLHRTPSGRLQLRRPSGRRRLTRAAEQAFLAALSATANIRLSAAAAGFSHSAFYARKKESPAFAREWRLALAMGYERLDLALVASTLADAHGDDAWRHNDPPPIPPMTCNQALQLLYLHQKEARLVAEPDYIKRRRGESDDAHSFRLHAMDQARQQRQREAFEVAEALRREGKPSRFEPAAPLLPALDQVTGWSKAKPRAAGAADYETGRPATRAPAERKATPRDATESPPAPDDEEDRVWMPGLPDGCDLSDTEAAPEGPVYHEDIALFGGWRLKDWEEWGR